MSRTIQKSGDIVKGEAVEDRVHWYRPVIGLGLKSQVDLIKQLVRSLAHRELDHWLIDGRSVIKC